MRFKGSWSAEWEGAALHIFGTTDLYPNDFSTASLARTSQLEHEVIVYRIAFARDKEPFCGPDLVGPVHYFERALPSSARRIRITVPGDEDYVELSVPEG